MTVKELLEKQRYEDQIICLNSVTGKVVVPMDEILKEKEYEEILSNEVISWCYDLEYYFVEIEC